MVMMRLPVVAALLFIALAPLASTAVAAADSVADFSDTQGSGNWFYGLYNQGAVGGDPHGYTAGSFEQFDLFNVGGNRWKASDALVGAQNNDFLDLTSVGGHPAGIGPGSQDSIIWSIRRYVAPAAGVAQIDFDLFKLNTSTALGGGITGRIFVDGTEIYTQFVENTDDVGFSQILNVPVGAGSTIDFAIDPTGILVIPPPELELPPDSIYAARGDATLFRSTIEIVPEPSSIVLLLGGLTALLSVRRGTRRTAH